MRTLLGLGRLYRRGAARAESGSAALEFAIVLPLLLLFMGGIFDFGLAFAAQSQLNHAAGQGAEYCARHPGDTAGTRRRVTADLSTRVVVDESGTSCAAVGRGAVVTVKAAGTYSSITGQVIGSGGLKLGATGSAVAR